MSITEIIGFVIGSLITVVVSGYLGGKQAREAISETVAKRIKAEQETENIRVEREQKLNEIIEKQDKSIADLRADAEAKDKRLSELGETVAKQGKEIAGLRAAMELKDARILELERKFTDLSAYVGELLAGIDMLIEQITVKHKDTPVWHPNRRKEDK